MSQQEQTQRALLAPSIGAPLVLVHDRPIPQPGPNQVQIKISVVELNPHNQAIRDTGLYMGPDQFPLILCLDVVGTVSKLGERVEGFAVGDRVVTWAKWAEGSVHSGLQEYSIADVGTMCKIPETVSDDDAATLPTNLLSTFVALFDILGLPAPWTASSHSDSSVNLKKEAILVIGGGSNCGKFTVQLAKLSGFGKIVVVGGSEKELKAFGATQVIDRHGSQDAILAAIRDVVGDDLVYAVDCVNPPPSQTFALFALSSHKRGKLARLLPLGPVDETKVHGKKAGFEVLDVKASLAANKPVCLEFWKRLPDYLETGRIRCLPYDVIGGLEEGVVNRALDRYRVGGDGWRMGHPHVHI